MTKIARLQQLLGQLAQEITTTHFKAVKAQKAAVLHMIVTGEKLQLAHRLLARLKTRLRRKRCPPPPTWKEWVESNCQMKVRMSYWYIYLHRHKDDEAVKQGLEQENPSLRKLIRAIAQGLDERDETQRADEARARPRETPKRAVLARGGLRKWFAEKVKELSDNEAVYLLDYGTDLMQARWRAVVREAKPMASRVVPAVLKQEEEEARISYLDHPDYAAALDRITAAMKVEIIDNFRLVTGDLTDHQRATLMNVLGMDREHLGAQCRELWKPAGITNPMHRRILAFVLEELLNPEPEPPAAAALVETA